MQVAGGIKVLSPASLEHTEITEIIFSLPDFLRGKIRQNNQAGKAI
jgi:hypothetical protein